MSQSHLESLKSRESRRVVGLNSGTSMDGIDAMAVVFRGSGKGIRWQVECFEETPLPPALAECAQRGETLTPSEVDELDQALGQVFADAASSIVRRAGWDRADLIGSHGQTVLHIPGTSGQVTRTIQLGRPSIIAQQLDTSVVSNFRVADCAVGGQGAPLIPYLDAILFPDGPPTSVINLGGIANVTHIHQGQVLAAYDIGPANLPLDLLTICLTKGLSRYDRNGTLARTGNLHQPLLNELLSHPFLSITPPRTTGRELFGGSFIADLILKHPDIPTLDLLTTATEWVAQTVAQSAHSSGAQRVVISGGGALNTYLMERIDIALGTAILTTSSSVGVDPLAKEALLFALLANDRIFDLPTNVPIATGACEVVSLGEITL